MMQVELLEQHVAELDEAAFAQFRAWFAEFEQSRWDKQIEADSNAGKLDFLINAALAEHQQGKTPNALTSETLQKSDRDEQVFAASDAASLFRQLGI
jgi:hypothetical protein